MRTGIRHQASGIVLLCDLCDSARDIIWIDPPQICGLRFIDIILISSYNAYWGEGNAYRFSSFLKCQEFALTGR